MTFRKSNGVASKRYICGMTLWASQTSAAWREVRILNIEFFRKDLSEATSSLSLNVVNSRNTTILLWWICLHNGRISMFPVFARCACAQQKTYAPFYMLLSREKSVSWHWRSGLSVHVTPLRHRTVEVDKEWRHCGSTGRPWKAQGSPFSRFNAVTTREDLLNCVKIELRMYNQSMLNHWKTCRNDLMYEMTFKEHKTKMLNQPVGRAGCAINLAKATGQNTRVLVFKSGLPEWKLKTVRKSPKQWHEKCWKCQFVKSESEVCKDKLPWRQKKLLQYEIFYVWIRWTHCRRFNLFGQAFLKCLRLWSVLSILHSHISGLCRTVREGCEGFVQILGGHCKPDIRHVRRMTRASLDCNLSSFSCRRFCCRQLFGSPTLTGSPFVGTRTNAGASIWICGPFRSPVKASWCIALDDFLQEKGEKGFKDSRWFNSKKI